MKMRMLCVPILLASIGSIKADAEKINPFAADLPVLFETSWWQLPQNIPLIDAAVSGNVQAVHDLLAAGENPDVQDPFGNTPLMYVVRLTVIDILKKAILDFPETTDPISDINLQAACIQVSDNYNQIITELLTYNADIQRANNAGQRPTDFAQANGWELPSNTEPQVQKDETDDSIAQFDDNQPETITDADTTEPAQSPLPNVTNPESLLQPNEVTNTAQDLVTQIPALQELVPVEIITEPIQPVVQELVDQLPAPIADRADDDGEISCCCVQPLTCITQTTAAVVMATANMVANGVSSVYHLFF